jgi:hypothetical protein
MATIRDITTGVQTVSATGAVTGTLDVSALTGDYTVKVRVTGLAAGKSLQVALEDTAHATVVSTSVEFDDATQPFVFSFTGGFDRDGIVLSVRSYEIPMTRVGATNNKLRLNVQSGTSSIAAGVYGWLEQ